MSPIHWVEVSPEAIFDLLLKNGTLRRFDVRKILLFFAPHRVRGLHPFDLRGQKPQPRVRHGEEGARQHFQCLLENGCTRAGYSHFDRVFLAVVNKGNHLVVSLDSVNGHTRPGFVFSRLQDVDVVDGLPISLVHLERLPIRRQARRDMQLVHLKPQPKKGFNDQPVHPPG